VIYSFQWVVSINNIGGDLGFLINFVFFKAFCKFNKGELICVKFFKNILAGNFFWVGYFVPTQDGRQQSPALYLNKVVSPDKSATASSVVNWHIYWVSLLTTKALIWSTSVLAAVEKVSFVNINPFKRSAVVVRFF